MRKKEINTATRKGGQNNTKNNNNITNSNKTSQRRKNSRLCPIIFEEPKDTKWKCSLNKNLIWNFVINKREIVVNSDVHWHCWWKNSRKMLIFMFPSLKFIGRYALYAFFTRLCLVFFCSFVKWLIYVLPWNRMCLTNISGENYVFRCVQSQMH